MKVYIIAVVSADGYIGKSGEHLSTAWTSKADKVFFTRTTKTSDAVIMGRKTFETFRRALPGRRLVVLSSDPAYEAPEGVEVTSEVPGALLERLKAEGAASIAIAGGASVYAQFLQAGFVDELYMTVEPVIFGDGVPLVGRPFEQRLQLLDTQPIGDGVVLLHYSVAR